MADKNDPGFVIAVVIFLIFFLGGGWKLIGLALLICIGSIFGYPAWWIRILIRKATGYDFVRDIPDMDSEDGLIYHAILGVFMAAGISIIFLVITRWLSGFIIGFSVLFFLFVTGEVSFWILSRFFRLKTKLSEWIVVIFGNMTLFSVLFVGYHLVIALKDVYQIIKNIF